ncbi:MAG: UxaA family hydrolase [Chloroflexota bacterium]
MKKEAMLIDRSDNVATALMPLERGHTVETALDDYSVSTRLLQDIPFGHKFALKDINRGQPVLKYGEAIGLATTDIRKGEHVHVHNVESQKGRGDRR